MNLENETMEQAIERLCKRHMAKTLTKFDQQENPLTPEQVRFIIKGFGYLMDDLKQESKCKGTANDRISEN